MSKKILPTFLFLSFLLMNFSLAANWIAGSSYTYDFPLCKSLEVKISASHPINLTVPEIEVYPNCTLVKNDTFNLEFECECYDGYVLNVKPHAFANNTYDVLISYTYEQKVPEKVVEKKETLIVKEEKPTINQTIVNRTVIRPTKIETVYVNATNESLLKEVENLKFQISQYESLAGNLTEENRRLKNDLNMATLCFTIILIVNVIALIAIVIFG